MSDRLLKHKTLPESFNILFSIKEKDIQDTFENDITYLVQKYSQLLLSCSFLEEIAELKLIYVLVNNHLSLI